MESLRIITSLGTGSGCVSVVRVRREKECNRLRRPSYYPVLVNGQ